MLKPLLQTPSRQFLANLGRFTGLLAGLVLVIGTSGCVSSRPGPLLVEHQVITAPASNWDNGLRLRLVTYNIWGLPSWLTGAPRGRYPQIARELERLDPDIILLQEAWTAKARKAVPAHGRWSIARPAGQHMLFQQSGLVTLSRFPIIGGEFYPFSRAAFPDRFVNKGVLKVTVQLSGGRVLNIWNVHMQDGNWPEIRRTQVRELVSRVQEAQDGQIADLVGGDFNCTPESPSGRELMRSLGPNVQQLDGGDPFVTWDGLSSKPGVGQTIDYIFVCGRATFQNLQAVPHVAFTAPSMAQRLSDHLGIEAEVNLTPAPSTARVADSRLEGYPLPGIAAHRTAYAR
jgi:endonuclease/exonuclease/phosphatase family metal-dependent hydrolase